MAGSGNRRGNFGSGNRGNSSGNSGSSGDRGNSGNSGSNSGGSAARGSTNTPDSARGGVHFQSPPPRTPPPPMRTDRIKNVDLYVMVLAHPIYGQRWADGWNSSYGITLHSGDLPDLFTEGSRDTDLPLLVPNPEQILVRAVRTAILSQAAPRADPQHDADFIRAYDSGAHLKIDVEAPILMRPNASTLARALRRCAAADTGLVLHLSLGHLFANFSVTPFNFRDLTLFSDTLFDGAPSCPRTFDNISTADQAPDVDRLVEAVGNIQVQPLPDTFASDLGVSLGSSLGTDLGTNLGRALGESLPSPSGNLLPDTFAADLRTAIADGVAAVQPPLPDPRPINFTIPANFMTDLRDAVSAGMADGLNATPPPANAANQNANPPQPQIPDTFDPTRLPSGAGNTPPTEEAYERYLAHEEQRVLTKTVIHTVYENGQRYHMDGVRRIVMADGTIFVRKDVDEKGLFRTVVQCDKTDPVGIRTWYHNFCDHLHAHGYFALPFWLYREDSGDTGFSCGDAPPGEHDLPLLMHLPCMQASNVIFRYLSSDKMFPAGSPLRDVVAASRGDGYRALKQIIYGVHPAFHRTPGILVSGPPTQGSDSILQYVLRFNDYLQLRAYIQNIASSIEDPDQRDLLFHGAKHSDYIIKMARADLRDPNLAHKFTANHLVETLQAYLKEPDSPLFKEWQDKQYKKLQSLDSTRSSPVFRPINPIDTLPSTDSSNSSFESTVDRYYEEACNLQPSTDDEARLQDLYAASILTVKANPIRNCLICGEPHTFDDCPVLNDTAFIRNHFIRFCQFLKRDQHHSRNGETWKGGSRPTSRTSSRPSSRNSQSSRSSPVGRSSPRARHPQQPTPIRAVDAMDATQEPSDHDLATLLSDHEPEDKNIPGAQYQDFLNGHWN